MQPIMSQQAATPALPAARMIVWASIGMLGALTAAAGVLWAHYGTAVFIETILTGIAACF
jgi:hypothetical protein